MDDNFKNKRYDYTLSDTSTNSRVDDKSFENAQEGTLSLESSLTTISENFKYFLEEIVDPKIVDANKNTIPVNIKHENAENIVDIQKLGYIRDNQSKMPIVPLISFKRLSIEKERLFPTLLRNKGENRVIIHSEANPKNKYFDSKGEEFQPTIEYYSVGVPDFVNIPFEVNIWTNYSYEMDHILERLYYYEGAFYGERSPSKISITDAGINIIKDVDGQRLIRSNVSFETKGKLILNDLNTAKNVTKDYSIRTININEKFE